MTLTDWDQNTTGPRGTSRTRRFLLCDAGPRLRILSRAKRKTNTDAPAGARGDWKRDHDVGGWTHVTWSIIAKTPTAPHAWVSVRTPLRHVPVLFKSVCAIGERWDQGAPIPWSPTRLQEGPQHQHIQPRDGAHSTKPSGKGHLKRASTVDSTYTISSKWQTYRAGEQISCQGLWWQGGGMLRTAGVNRKGWHEGDLCGGGQLCILIFFYPKMW